MGKQLSIDSKAVAQSLWRLAYNLYGWLAGLIRGLGLLMASGGWWWLAMAYGYKQEN